MGKKIVSLSKDGVRYDIPVEKNPVKMSKQDVDDCTNYEPESGICSSGCNEDGVELNADCPFKGRQGECSCYE